MWKLMGAWLFIFYNTLFAVVPPKAEDEAKPAEPLIQSAEQLKAMVEAQNAITSKDLFNRFHKKLPSTVEFVLGSRSRQSGNRALLFARDGSFLFGAGKNHSYAEVILSDPETGSRRFHVLSPRKNQPMELGEENPERCQTCHTKKLLLIWPLYGDPHANVLGGGNAVKETGYAELLRNDDWTASLLALREGETELKLSGGALIGRLTAKRLVSSLKAFNKERFERYKFALVRSLADCPSDEQEEKFVTSDYVRLVSKEDQEWMNWLGNEHEGRLLQLLGTNPDEIILQSAAKEFSNEKEKFEYYATQWDKFLPYRQYSDGTGDYEVIKKAMLWLMMDEVGVKSKNIHAAFFSNYVLEKGPPVNCKGLLESSLKGFRARPQGEPRMLKPPPRPH